jgi:hypothetical protein
MQVRVGAPLTPLTFTSARESGVQRPSPTSRIEDPMCNPGVDVDAADVQLSSRRHG